MRSAGRLAIRFRLAHQCCVRRVKQTVVRFAALARVGLNLFGAVLKVGVDQRRASPVIVVRLSWRRFLDRTAFGFPPSPESVLDTLVAPLPSRALEVVRLGAEA